MGTLWGLVEGGILHGLTKSTAHPNRHHFTLSTDHVVRTPAFYRGMMIRARAKYSLFEALDPHG